MEKTVSFEGMEEILKELAPNSVVNDPYYGPVSKAMASAGKMIEAQIKQNLRDNNSVGATGQLINAINSSNAVLEQDSIVVHVGAGGVPYAPAVEYGSKPHAIPPTELVKGGGLVRWVNLKKIAGDYKEDGRRIGGRKRILNENIKVARGIAAGIWKKGTKPHPFFYKAVDQQKDNINELLLEAIRSVHAKTLK